MTNLQDIVAEARKGKRQAQNVLMDLYWDDVYGYVYARIKDVDEAEDISIETFTKVFAKLKLYNSDFDFKTWLISIAHNTMIDHLRKSNRLNLSLDDETVYLNIQGQNPSPEESMILKQEDDEFYINLQKLKPDYKKIIELRYLEEKTYKEIAEELNLSMANVKVRILRARQLLQEIIKNQ